MSEIKLFRISGSVASEISGEGSRLEKSLQVLIERNSEIMLGVRFLATEYSTGKLHGGRIDTLGIDENGCPVIIEYKGAINENVINQGLYYLDWLLDHKAEFKLLVLNQLDSEAANSVEWSSPRLICIAGDFTKYDEHAVRQIDRNIDLVKYRRFESNFVLLEQVFSSVAAEISVDSESVSPHISGSKGDKPLSQVLLEMSDHTKDLYESVRAFANSLGDDVVERPLKLYLAFSRIKNFLSVVIRKDNLQLFVKIDPSAVSLEPGFTRDVREIGHWGTGDLEITVRSQADLTKAQPLIVQSYENS